MAIQKNNFLKYLLLTLLLATSYFYFSNEFNISEKRATKEVSEPDLSGKALEASGIYSNNKGIPQEAIQTLLYIRKNDKAPEGYEGGRQFMNRERRLPLKEHDETIYYREWDIYPKVKGQNRGARRLVTSSKKAYYTADHYRTFEKINE
jgi:ribonuclease T1